MKKMKIVRHSRAAREAGCGKLDLRESPDQQVPARSVSTIQAPAPVNRPLAPVIPGSNTLKGLAIDEIPDTVFQNADLADEIAVAVDLFSGLQTEAAVHGLTIMDNGVIQHAVLLLKVLLVIKGKGAPGLCTTGKS
jgi:hypothetical protein